MGDDDVRADLRAAPLFDGLAPDLVDRLAEGARRVRFAGGAPVFLEGEPADRWWLVHEGRVALEIHAPGGAIVVATIGPGQALGWSWLLPPYRWHLDARTVGDVVAFEWDGAALRARCEADHRLGHELMRRFAQVVVERLQATRLQLLDVYGADPGPPRPSGADAGADDAVV